MIIALFDQVNSTTVTDYVEELAARMRQNRNCEFSPVVDQCRDSIAAITGSNGVREIGGADQMTIFSVVNAVHQSGMTDRESFDFPPGWMLSYECMFVVDIIDRVAARNSDAGWVTPVVPGSEWAGVRRTDFVGLECEASGPQDIVKPSNASGKVFGN